MLLGTNGPGEEQGHGRHRHTQDQKGTLAVALIATVVGMTGAGTWPAPAPNTSAVRLVTYHASLSTDEVDDLRRKIDILQATERAEAQKTHDAVVKRRTTLEQRDIRPTS